MTNMVLRVAAKALIINDEGHVLLLREAAAYQDSTQQGRYGLPGGRLEIGETFVDGLHREVREETGLEVEPLYPLYVGEWRPAIKGVPHQIVAIFVACQAKTSNVRLSDEHDEMRWIDPRDHKKYDIMDPDWKVIDIYLARKTQ
jgi:8-oxo-dGTP pyrophosphatase MutT (NUDIX family)